MGGAWPRFAPVCDPSAMSKQKCKPKALGKTLCWEKSLRGAQVVLSRHSTLTNVADSPIGGCTSRCCQLCDHAYRSIGVKHAPMAAGRRRDGDDRDIGRHVRPRRGVSMQTTSASALMSIDSNADPTQSQAASWHPSQPQPVGDGRGIAHGPPARSQQDAWAEGIAPVAASQSAAHTRLLAARGTAHASQPSARGPLGLPAPDARNVEGPFPPEPASHGRNVWRRNSAGAEGEGRAAGLLAPAEEARRMTRSLTALARQSPAPASTLTDADAAAMPNEGTTLLPAMQGIGRSSGRARRQLLDRTDADSGEQASAPVFSADSQRTASRAPAPPAVGQDHGMQRITRFFSPLTALWPARSSQQQRSQASGGAGAGQTEALQEPQQGGASAGEATSVERRHPSQPAEHGNWAPPPRPSQPPSSEQQGRQPSQRSMEAPAGAGGLPQRSPANARRAVAVSNADVVPAMQRTFQVTASVGPCFPEMQQPRPPGQVQGSRNAERFLLSTHMDAAWTSVAEHISNGEVHLVPEQPPTADASWSPRFDQENISHAEDALPLWAPAGGAAEDQTCAAGLTYASASRYEPATAMVREHIARML